MWPICMNAKSMKNLSFFFKEFIFQPIKNVCRLLLKTSFSCNPKKISFEMFKWQLWFFICAFIAFPLEKVVLANQIPESASQIQMLSYVQASLPGWLLNVFTYGSMFHTKHALNVCHNQLNEPVFALCGFCGLSVGCLVCVLWPSVYLLRYNIFFWHH